MDYPETEEPDHRRQAALRVRRDRALFLSMSSGAGVRVATLLLAFATVAVSARAVGVSAFGVVATLSAMLGLTGFSDLGIGLGLMTRIAQAHGRDDITAIKSLTSSAMISLLVVGGLVATLGIASVWLLPWRALLGNPDLSSLSLSSSVGIFAGSVGVGIPASIGQRILLGTQRGAQVNAWNFLSFLMQFLFSIVASEFGAPVWAFVFIAVALPVVVNCLQTAWVFMREPTLRPARQEISMEVVRDLLNFGALFFALNLIVAVAYQSDTLIVSTSLGASSAAVFAVAVRMFNAPASLFASSLQQFWPSMAEALVRGDIAWTRRRFRQVLFFSTILLALAVGALVVIGGWVAKVWVGDTLVPPRGLLAALATWTVYGHVMSQVSALLNAAGVVRPQVLIAAAMLCLNLPLSIWLTREIGLAGPAIGSLTAHVVCSLVPSVLMARRILR